MNAPRNPIDPSAPPDPSALPDSTESVVTDVPSHSRLCEVCGAEIAVGVASSTFGAASYAIGNACLTAGAEPYAFVVGGLLGLSREDVAASPTIAASLEVAGKTEDELWADVAKADSDLDACNARLSAERASADLASLKPRTPAPPEPPRAAVDRNRICTMIREGRIVAFLGRRTPAVTVADRRFVTLVVLGGLRTAVVDVVYELAKRGCDPTRIPVLRPEDVVLDAHRECLRVYIPHAVEIEIADLLEADRTYCNPVHEENGAWWFWDETWADRDGPFPCEWAAEAACAWYCECLEKGPHIADYGRARVALGLGTRIVEETDR